MTRKRPRQTGKNHVARAAKDAARGTGSPRQHGTTPSAFVKPGVTGKPAAGTPSSRSQGPKPPPPPKTSAYVPKRAANATASRPAGPQRGANPVARKPAAPTARKPAAQGAPKPWEAHAARGTRHGRPAPGTSKRPGQSWGHSAPPSRARLEELLKGHGVELPSTTLDKVWQYHQILRRNNHDLDLTRLIGFETIVQRHYADCLILHKLMKELRGGWPSPLVDIGTGAGFPGIMLKIASPATQVILSEPRNVRVDYLNNTIHEMGLKDISVFGHKFTSKSFTTPVMGVITRAFEPIQKTLPRLQNCLQVGGLAMFMKGPGVDEELSQPIPPEYRLVRDFRYRIPRTTLDRAFVVFERIA